MKAPSFDNVCKQDGRTVNSLMSLFLVTREDSNNRLIFPEKKQSNVSFCFPRNTESSQISAILPGIKCKYHWDSCSCKRQKETVDINTRVFSYKCSWKLRVLLFEQATFVLKYMATKISAEESKGKILSVNPPQND